MIRLKYTPIPPKRDTKTRLRGKLDTHHTDGDLAKVKVTGIDMDTAIMVP
jgi:hypothetical protein